MPVGALSRDAAGVVGAGAVSREGIWQRLHAMGEHRGRRGRVYPLAVLAAVWLCALTAAGHDRVTAVIEWLAGTTEEERRRPRLPYDPFDGYRLPSESTIRRFLNDTDDARLARALLDPPLADPAPPTAVLPEVAGETVRAVYALDGKTSRGAKRADGRQVQLVGVADQATGRLVNQHEVDSKSNETKAFRPVLEPLDLARDLLTFDAPHTVRDNLDWLVTDKKAHYLAVVKGNQPTLRAFLAGLPWADVPVADTTHDHGHGRDETRTLKAATVEHAEFPHARQAVRIQRWRREKGGKPSRETVYGITDLAFEQASAGFLADAARGQWIIENRQHHVRDVTFGEDASRSRTHRGPANLAIFRATVAHAVRAAGHRYVPAGRRACKTATAALDLYGFP